MLIPSIAQVPGVDPGEIPSVRWQHEFLVPRRYLHAGPEDQTRKATLLHSWTTILEFLGPVRDTRPGILEASALIARRHALGEATLM